MGLTGLTGYTSGHCRIYPDIALFNQTIARATDDKTEFNFEHRLLLPDGRVNYVHVVAHTLEHESGRKEFVGAVMDVTVHHEARIALERALSEIKRSEKSLRLVVDNIPGLVCTLSAAGKVETVNQRVLDYTANGHGIIIGLDLPACSIDLLL